ncbi:MAG: OprD family porin [Candidatus Adiutrix sp.]|jgi:hypothetical protein|nr:OprD family porin [Candidatus Adiutrix sp.]
MKPLIRLIMIALLLSIAPTARAADNASPAAAPEASSPFWRDAKFSANLYYFQRYRDRLEKSTDHYGVNLSHASSQLSLDFESGWLGDFLGFDFGVFGAYDFYNDSAGADHEMNFVYWRDPWHPEWNSSKNKDAASVYKALMKMKAGPLWARAGYFQPQGPGVLGVNWSFLPGTYQGAEVGADLGRLTLAVAWADEYKAPWYTDTYHFQKADGRGNFQQVDYLWSLGARYQATERLSLEAAYGQSQSYLWNAHLKAKYELPLADGDTLRLAAHSYFINDINGAGAMDDNVSATALQQYLAAIYSTGPWTLNAEFTYSRAPHEQAGQVNYFAYRLVRPSGGAKGAYEPWWDLRSDWDHHQEKAVFFKAGRALDDLGLSGVKAAVSGAYGWGGRAWGSPETFSEAALGLDLSYTVDQGPLAGAIFALHFTYYDNRTDLPSWDTFQNAFQDEHDVKFTMIIPLTK